MIDEKKLIEDIKRNKLLAREAATCRCIEYINNQPQVQQWIPCSERLPDETGYYLITYSRKYCKNEMAVGFFSREDCDTDFGNPWEVSTYGDLKEILAWQPLPSVWKGENNAEK